MNKNTHSDLAYCPENVLLYESIYGKNLISIGGKPAIDNMFSDLDIRGLKALDLGFGLGGVAFHLADKYQMKVSGIELHPWMVFHARKHTPMHLVANLTFDVYDTQGELPYKASSFDLVFSKGVLNHVHEKDNLFQKINSLLEPGGLFVIADWVFPQNIVPSSELMVCETKESYEHVLRNSGFTEVTFRDDSQVFLFYINQLLENLSKNQVFIEHTYGTELFSTIWAQHKELIDNITHQRKVAVRILAKNAA